MTRRPARGGPGCEFVYEDCALAALNAGFTHGSPVMSGRLGPRPVPSRAAAPAWGRPTKPHMVHVEPCDTVALMAPCVESRRHDGGQVRAALAGTLAGLPPSVDALVLDLDHAPGCPAGHELPPCSTTGEPHVRFWVVAVAVAGGRARIVSIPPEPVSPEPAAQGLPPPEPATPGPVPPRSVPPGPVASVSPRSATTYGGGWRRSGPSASTAPVRERRHDARDMSSGRSLCRCRHSRPMPRMAPGSGGTRAERPRRCRRPERIGGVQWFWWQRM